MKWLKNIIKNAVKEYIKEDNVRFVEGAIEHVILSKEDVNVLAIDCGRMPIGKAQDHLRKLSSYFKDQHPDYKVVLISKMRYD